MESITLINGNKQPVTRDLPKLVIVTRTEWNDVAMNHVKENTGLSFERTYWGYEAQPTESYQIAALLMTYNFKTRYYDNGDFRNQLHLKSDHNVGYDVNHICFDCCKANYIHTGDMTQDDRLNC